MSRHNSCKKWRHELFKSFKILLCPERNSGEVREGYVPFSSGASNFFSCFLTVHYSIDLFHLPTLMYNSFIH